MWTSYALIALRLMARNRLHAAITVGGLVLGLAGCLLILSYIRFERGYDRWLPDSGRIYQVQSRQSDPGQPIVRSQNSPMPLHDLLPAAFPQIEAISAVSAGPTVTTRDGEATFIDSLTVDQGFFRIFRLPFASGNAGDPLPDTNSVVLTRAEAIKQFGTPAVAGRNITLGAGPGKRDYRVTAVLRDLPRDTNLHFGIVFLRDPAEASRLPPEARGWASNHQQHYVLLRQGADAGAINAALPAWIKRSVSPRPVADALGLTLVPIRAVHLGEATDGAMTPLGDPVALASFAIVAALTLVMAVLNFINLSTARASTRAREIALRKTLGATRGQLIVQFLAEALVTAAVAMLLALTLAELVAAPLGARLGVPLRIDYLGEGGMALPALGLLVAVGLLGGLYPAFYLSRFQPARVLHADFSVPASPAAGRFRIALVVTQFATAIGLLACTAIIYAQTRYVETVDPGYRRDGLVQIDAAWRFAGDPAEFAAARRDLLAIPGVASVGRTSLGLAADTRTSLTARAPDGGADLSIGYYGIDDALLQTMDVPLLAGRFLDEHHGNDHVLHASDDADAHPLATRGVNILVNRSALARFGWRAPADAIGRTVRIALDGADLVPATIVGVVGDARVRTAREAAEPIVYGYDPDRTSQVIVRYAAARPGAVMAGLHRVWRRYEPEIPFQARFAEDIVAQVYAADRARGSLFAAFTALAVVIACLGLYGLAAFTAERRRKEIGIRKVLGARVRDIVRLLAWHFCRPVVLANLIAWPIAWWAMREWLNRFELRIALGPAPFLSAGALALVIAFLTISGHALRAARANPIHALRSE